jgi:exodeoxyribonuclease V alpha subunit
VGWSAGPEGEGPQVYFPGEGAAVRRFPASRLPELDTVYAMTVHKSQGSEFDEVLLILPDKDYPVLTRELLYTAVTRARRRVILRAGEQVLRTAVSRKIVRTSGLRDALWGVV